jgi:hypothetical protein
MERKMEIMMNRKGEFIQGAILGLVVPSLEHERTTVVIPVHGSEPEVENMQEDMQEGFTQEEIPEEAANVVDRRGMTNEQDRYATRMST